MTYSEIENNTFALLKYIESENYLGYDPYDFYLSPIAKYFPKSILFLHLQKVSPINLRPLLKIQKGMVTKVYAHLVDSYLNLYHLTSNKLYFQNAIELYNLMLKAAVIHTETEIGWGRNYPFKTGGEIHDNKKPLVYLNSRLGQTMIKMYDETHDKKILTDLEKVIRNLLNTGRVIYKDNYAFIGYSPDKNTRLTFNVSAVAVELIMAFLDRSDNWDYKIDNYNLKNISLSVLETILHYQEEDGSWTYGYAANGQLFSQKDFHQGFIIDSLYNIIPLIKDTSLQERVKNSYSKGYEYLKNVQINDCGQFFWRYPKKYPIDIHNQAQGILSLSLNGFDESNDKLNLMLDLVFKSLWNSKKHCFFYQKWPLFTNKISYMRWCNSWMLYALTTYLLKNKN